MSSFRDDLLRDRVVWITGGATGIGWGIAQAAARHGARVVLCGRRQEKLDEAVDRLTALGASAWAQRCDVRRPDEVATVAAAIEAREGRLDALVNNAAGNFLAPAATLSPNGFGAVIDIDLKGTFHCTRAAFPLLHAAKGSVLSISATLHYAGTPFQVHAASAKAGIDALTRTLGAEWGPLGIRVNAIAPGPIAGTEGIDRLAPQGMGDLTEFIPLRRFGTPEDVAHMALFLLSDLASWVTGSVFVVDGGAWLAAAAPIRSLGGGS